MNMETTQKLIFRVVGFESKSSAVGGIPLVRHVLRDFHKVLLSGIIWNLIKLPFPNNCENILNYVRELHINI